MDSSPDVIEADVTELLTKNAYLFEDLDIGDSNKGFHSDFVLRLLAATYVPSIKGHIRVDAIDTIGLSHCGIKGILGLAGAAVFYFSVPRVPRYLPDTFRHRSSVRYNSSTPLD